jgi:hypothetical protein
MKKKFTIKGCLLTKHSRRYGGMVRFRVLKFPDMLLLEVLVFSIA